MKGCFALLLAMNMPVMIPKISADNYTYVCRLYKPNTPCYNISQGHFEFIKETIEIYKDYEIDYIRTKLA